MEHLIASIDIKAEWSVYNQVKGMFYYLSRHSIYIKAITSNYSALTRNIDKNTKSICKKQTVIIYWN